jgi:hypothetical protein
MRLSRIFVIEIGSGEMAVFDKIWSLVQFASDSKSERYLRAVAAATLTRRVVRLRIQTNLCSTPCRRANQVSASSNATVP